MWPEIRRASSEWVRSVSSLHRPDGRPDVCLFTTPRSGSTWLMELLASQPGFKPISEPFDLRNASIRKHLGIADWVQLYNRDSEPLVRRYVEGLRSGRLRFLNPRPSLLHPRLLTRRIVFKILHFGEDRIPWFRDSFGARLVLLLRHPIPVSLSRREYPRLEAFMQSDYRRHFTPAQLALARRVADTGSKLERGVLDWCFQNAPPLRQAEPDWIVLSYEQLLLEPRPLVERLARELDLTDAATMLARLHRPSRTANKSDRRTAQVLEEPESAERTRWLLERWRAKVDRDEEKRAMEILERFEIDVYAAGEALPTGRLGFRMALAAPAVASGHA
jgi:hypothetical protein